MICTAHGSWVGPALHTNPAQSHTTAGEELLDDISVDDISVDDLSVDDLSANDPSERWKPCILGSDVDFYIIPQSCSGRRCSGHVFLSVFSPSQVSRGSFMLAIFLVFFFL